MAYINSVKCGVSATDTYENWRKFSNSNNNYRRHAIIGNGVITSCCAVDTYPNYQDRFLNIEDGIIAFADACFNKPSVTEIVTPARLQRIGNHCFENSNITTILLPETLEEIGHNNFPKTLQSISIPPKITDFPVDNLILCDYITEISLHTDSKSYKVIDGILYNYDLTEIVFCPNGKKGKVIIPNSVKNIGRYCFYNCKSLISIIIPTSVENIGEYAFSGISLDKLVIPNSVISIGEGCFYRAMICNVFKLSQNVSIIPNDCFYLAKLPQIDFMKRVEFIGDGTFDVRGVEESLPKIVSLQKTKYIGIEAFYEETGTETFELFSCLEMIKANAFEATAENQIIRYFSYVPISVDNNAFQGMSDKAVLIVPKGTKLIFENAIPWASFDDIQEMDLTVNIVEKENVTISDEEYFLRLQSVVDSITRVDYNYLKEIIQNISYNYQYVNTDQEYEEALSLIAYNNRFSPAIIPNLELDLCRNWDGKYKLKILEKAMLEYPRITMSMPPIYSDLNLIDNIDTSLIDTSKNVIPKSITIESYFANIKARVQSELLRARSVIKIAISWFTNYDLFKTVKLLAERGVEIKMVINNDSINNGGYCLNFNELLSKHNVEINLIEYPHLLHHKFCIIDDKTVINGSYNWTRFSDSNYENIMLIKNDEITIQSFNQEFERIIELSDYKHIDRMPDVVPVRPEYDRYAFKQFITEELDDEARRTVNERNKITALHKAARLNPEYLEKIHPFAQSTYTEAFKILDGTCCVQNDIEQMLDDSKDNKYNIRDIIVEQPINISNNPDLEHDSLVDRIVPKCQNPICQNPKIDQLKAKSVFLVLDISGSMRELYDAGHVHNIAVKVLTASLTLSDSKEVLLWTFSNVANYIGKIGLDNFNSIRQIQYKVKGQTNLGAFISKANKSINENSLVLIFTDDDSKSIENAITGMKDKPKVFWQIIVYRKHKNISSTIDGIHNVSLVCMDDYASKNDKEIYQILLKDYLAWKKR